MFNRPYPPSGIGVVASVASSRGPNQPCVVLPAPSPVMMIDPSTMLAPRMSRLPATTTPCSVLGAFDGSVNEPISMFVCGRTIVAVVWPLCGSIHLLSNIVAPVNSIEFVKCVYAVGTSDASGPLIVQLLNRRLLPASKPCEFDVVRTVSALNVPDFIFFDQVEPSF